MKKFAVIGHPIAHSKSPILHRAGFVELEIDAEFSAVDLSPDRLEDWIRDEFRPNFTGAAITIPHKIAVRQFCDFETEAAKKIGAVNTLFKKDEQIFGTNTDAVGAIRAIHTAEQNLREKKALVLGAGGAARAVIFALRSAEMQVWIWNRTASRARDLAREFDAKFLETDHLLPKIFAEFDLVANTTSVGLKKWESPVPAEFWRADQIAFDAVYDPLETRFLAEAADAGATTITGDKMLCFQAIEQFKIWHGVEPELEIFERAFFE